MKQCKQVTEKEETRSNKNKEDVNQINEKILIDYCRQKKKNKAKK